MFQTPKKGEPKNLKKYTLKNMPVNDYAKEASGSHQ